MVQKREWKGQQKTWPLTAEFSVAVKETIGKDICVFVTVTFFEGKFPRSGVTVTHATVDQVKIPLSKPLKTIQNGTVTFLTWAINGNPFLVEVTGVDHKNRPFSFSSMLKVNEEKKRASKFSPLSWYRYDEDPNIFLIPLQLLTESDEAVKDEVTISANKKIKFGVNKVTNLSELHGARTTKRQIPEKGAELAVTFEGWECQLFLKLDKAKKTEIITLYK